MTENMPSFEHMHSKLVKSAKIITNIFFQLNSNGVSNSTEFYGDFKISWNGIKKF
jgi:hypothetical protein